MYSSWTPNLNRLRDPFDVRALLKHLPQLELLQIASHEKWCLYELSEHHSIPTQVEALDHLAVPERVSYALVL